MTAPLTHYWRVRKMLPERYGQSCRVLARPSPISVEIEFADGVRHVADRLFIRARRRG